MGRRLDYAVPRIAFTHEQSGTLRPPINSLPETKVRRSREGEEIDPASWLTPTSLPLTWARPAPRLPGIHNAGNTCYMNAALQCLLHLPPFVSAITSRPPSRSAGFCAHCALTSVNRDLTQRHGAVFARALTQNLRRISPNLHVNAMEDAHEFLTALLAGCARAFTLGCSRASSSLIPAPEAEAATPVYEALGGLLQSRVECSECGHASTKDEPFLDLALEIDRARSVPDALRTFTEAEYLCGKNKYRCDRCKRLVNASKRMSVRRAPNVLTVVLKRFSGTRKNNATIRYPINLDLSPYMIGKPDNVEASYELTGVLMHEGRSTRSGHYTAYVKSPNGVWSLKDDQTSRDVSTRIVLGRQAYLLFYTRVPPKVKLFKAPKDPCGLSSALNIDQELLAVTTKPSPWVESAQMSDSTLGDPNSSSRSSSPPALPNGRCPISALPSRNQAMDINMPEQMSQKTEESSAPQNRPVKMTSNVALTSGNQLPKPVAAVQGPVLRRMDAMIPEDDSLTAPSVEHSSSRPEVPPLDLSAVDLSTSTSPQSPSVMSTVKNILVIGMNTAKKAVHRAFQRKPSPPSSPLKPAPAAPQELADTEESDPASEDTVPKRPRSDRLYGRPEHIAKLRKSQTFVKEDVPVWGNVEDSGNGVISNSAPVKEIRKRKRANDELDAEYDQGKAKRVRSKSSIDKQAFTRFADACK